MKTQEMEPDEEYWRAKIAEISDELQDLKDRRELQGELMGILWHFLDRVDEAMQCDGEACAADCLKALEHVCGMLQDTSYLVCNQEEQDAFNGLRDNAGNALIVTHRLLRKYEAQREAFQNSIGNPACAPLVYHGIARTASEIYSPRSWDFCLEKCPYIEKCEW